MEYLAINSTRSDDKVNDNNDPNNNTDTNEDDVNKNDLDTDDTVSILLQTTIYNSGKKLHESWQNGKNIEPEEYKKMYVGPSDILDLAGQ